MGREGTTSSEETVPGQGVVGNSSSYPYSNWWYGVVLLLLVVILGYVGIGIMFWTSEAEWLERLIVSNDFLKTILISGAALGVIATSNVLTPFIALFLFMDARALSKKGAPWTPNPYLWGGIAFLPLLATVVDFPISSSLIILIALLYLVLRRTRVGLFSPHQG